jgi:hypothetical protein
MPGNLDAKTVEAAKPRATPYRLSDGGGLLLEVRPSGARVWLCRLTVDGKRRDIGLGGYPAVSLKDARDRALAARKQAGSGLDPVAEKQRERREREAARDAEAEAATRTFKAVALACISAQSPGWKDAKTAVMWTGSLERWAFPTLGKMPIAEVDRAAVLAAVGEVWRTRPATGRKVLRRVGAVLELPRFRGRMAGRDQSFSAMALASYSMGER